MTARRAPTMTDDEYHRAAWNAVIEQLGLVARALDTVRSMPCTEEQYMAAFRALAHLDGAAGRFHGSLSGRMVGWRPVEVR